MSPRSSGLKKTQWSVVGRFMQLISRPQKRRQLYFTMRFQLTALLPLLGLSFAQIEPDYTSSTCVSIYNPSDFFDTTGPWSLMSKAGDTLYIAGQSL